jgi:hypothetical protein
MVVKNMFPILDRKRSLFFIRRFQPCLPDHIQGYIDGESRPGGLSKLRDNTLDDVNNCVIVGTSQEQEKTFNCDEY